MAKSFECRYGVHDQAPPAYVPARAGVQAITLQRLRSAHDRLPLEVKATSPQRPRPTSTAHHHLHPTLQVLCLRLQDLTYRASVGQRRCQMRIQTYDELRSYHFSLCRIKTGRSATSPSCIHTQLLQRQLESEEIEVVGGYHTYSFRRYRCLP